MNVIWKYDVPLLDRFTIEMPEYAHILCIQVQGNTPVMWAFIDTDHELIKREFITCGTGNQIHTSAGDMIYVDTYQQPHPVGERALPYFTNGLVWHVFEVFS